MGNCLGNWTTIQGKSTEVLIEKTTVEAAFEELDTIYLKPLGLSLDQIRELQNSYLKL